MYNYHIEACRRETDSLVNIVKYIDHLVIERTAHLNPYLNTPVEYRPVNYKELYNEWVEAKNREYSRLIFGCFQHHRSIYQYTRRLLKAYKSMVIAIIAVHSLYTVTFICLIVEDTVSVRFIIWTGGILFVGVFLFLVSHFGEHFIAINNRYRNALYETEWYNKSIGQQKLILLQLMVTNFNLRMSFAHTIYLSDEFYTRVLRRCYAVINFLVNLKSF